MRDALNATGRPIMYSLCNWGTGGPHLWGQETGHSWRTGRDVFAVWDEHTARSVLVLPALTVHRVRTMTTRLVCVRSYFVLTVLPTLPTLPHYYPH